MYKRISKKDRASTEIEEILTNSKVLKDLFLKDDSVTQKKNNFDENSEMLL
jgi:hypothetical protein